MDLSLDTLRAIAIPLLRPYARRVTLFGSAARGEAGPESDVDLLIALRAPEDRPPLGLRFFALEQELGDRLGRPVELVTEAALSRHVRPFVERDAVVLYEER